MCICMCIQGYGNTDTPANASSVPAVDLGTVKGVYPTKIAAGRENTCVGM
jgi:outer membrane lipoprotein SlyB